jgi:hypothetical protein
MRSAVPEFAVAVVMVPVRAVAEVKARDPV